MSLSFTPIDLELTAREREVLGAYASGAGSAAEVAGRLGISIHTVRTHEANAREKLNVASTMQAVIKAITSDILKTA
jgi:DNA-binding CsgD family transcriptional regulator